MAKPPTYHSGFNADLLAFIPPNSRKVLEFGCGTGALATQFKRINPRCEIWGVEGHQESCDLARRQSGVDWAFCEDAEKFDPVAESKIMAGCPEPVFSTVVFGDILEHLVDPHGLVKRCAEWLEPGGSMVACIPNAQHFSVIRTLLEGQWPLLDSGLYDASHLRWFTRDSMVEMFEDAGLSIARVSPRVFNTDGSGPLIEAVRKFGLVSDPARFSKDCLAYQLVIHAFKGEIPTRKILVRGFAAEACCARPRLTEPGSFINTIPGFRYSETPVEVEDGEAVVVVRQRWNISEDAVRKHLKDGCLVVGEWDDDPWHKGFRGTKLKVFDVEWALKACHAISVSTEAIAELVRPINPNVAVFPNQVAAVGPEREYVADGVVRVYMGGQRNREDWAEAVAVVNEIVAENPDRYHFVVVHDRDLYEALETKHKTYYAFQPYEKYRELLRSCDVALMPLAETRFNRCKSDITEIECGAEDVVHMRYATELDIEPGDLADWPVSPRGDVIDDRMLADHYQDRAAWFNKLIDDKAELDRQLSERLPELKEALG